MSESYIISIGRQLGSGGREIGQKLAAQLGISFYDKELIRIAAKESGVKEEFFERIDEKKRFSLFRGPVDLRGTFTDEVFSNYYLSNEALFRMQSNVMRQLAEKHSCLFVGRCADYVLKDHPRCLNVFITADIEDRIRRIAEIQKLSEKKAKDQIEKTDRSRAGYYNYFTGKSWGVAESYHLCVNSSILGIDETVTFIRRFTEKRFGFSGNPR
jgi:cytidylate kinase